jgi:hypothetical protein
LSLVFFSSIIYSMTSSPFVSFPLQLWIFRPRELRCCLTIRLTKRLTTWIHHPYPCQPRHLSSLTRRRSSHWV